MLLAAVIVGTIASWGRSARRREGSAQSEIKRIHRVAEAAVSGRPPAEVIASAQDELARGRCSRAASRPSRTTASEWHLLEALVRNSGKLVSQRQLLQEVWGPAYGDESNYLRVHMAHLRHKLEPDRARPRYFITEPGLGSRFAGL